MEARASSDLSFIGMWNISFIVMWPLHNQSYCSISMKNGSNVIIYRYTKLNYNILDLRVPDEVYSRNASCSLNLISTFLLQDKIIITARGVVVWIFPSFMCHVYFPSYYHNKYGITVLSKDKKKSRICIVLAHPNSNPRANMSLHSEISFCFLPSQPLFLLLNDACLVDKQENPFLYSPWFDPTGVRTNDQRHSLQAY